MQWMVLDTWIVIIGALCAMACALPGCFLVLRRMSMMGDAISHAVLPGLAAAFLLTASRASFTMFIGAAIVGVATAVFTQWITGLGRVERGAAMGIVFTTLFAVGLILIEQAKHQLVDLDPGCVLYGAIELAPNHVAWQFQLGGASIGVPVAVVVLGSVLLFNAVVVVLAFKELRISSFDPQLATTLGINATAMHYLLMIVTAITTVAAFEAVGSIIVIAMLIVPPAAAYLLTDRMPVMIVISLVLAGGSAFLGHVAAITLPQTIGFDSASTSGMMAVTVGGFFVLAWLFSPRHGLIARRLNQRRLAQSIESKVMA